MNTIEQSAIEIPEKSLLEYTRDKHRHRTGVMLAFPQDNEILIGWSKCKTRGKNKDKFDKKLGVDIAKARAEKYLNWCSVMDILPYSMIDSIARFSIKCMKYYTKNGNSFQFPSWLADDCVFPYWIVDKFIKKPIYEKETEQTK